MLLFLPPLVIFLGCTKTPFKETKQFIDLLPPASHDVPDIWPVVEHGVQEGIHNVGHRGKVPQKQLEISSNFVEEWSVGVVPQAVQLVGEPSENEAQDQ